MNNFVCKLCEHEELLTPSSFIRCKCGKCGKYGITSNSERKYITEYIFSYPIELIYIPYAKTIYVYRKDYKEDLLVVKDIKEFSSLVAKEWAEWLEIRAVFS